MGGVHAPRSPQNVSDFTSRSFIDDPYPTYHHLRTALPVCWDKRFQWWLVSRYADVHAICRDGRWSSNHLDFYMSFLPPAERAEAAPLRELLTRRLIHTDEPEHRRIRMLMQLAFGPRQVERMRAVIREEVDALIAARLPAGGMDVVADLADPLTSKVIAAVLGLPPDDRHRFKEWTNDIYGFLGLSGTPIRVRARRATESAVKIRAYLASLFADLRRDPGEGLLGAMVLAEEQGERLSETELFSNVVGLINGSHDTSTNMIANTVYALLHQPGQYRLLTHDPSLAAAAVEEGIRFESPIQMLMRRATQDMDVGGVQVPRGDHAVILLGAANRDPAVFTDPDRFDISRTPAKNFAFGGGPHFCLGAALARLEGQLVLDTLCRRFPDLRLGAEPIAWRPLPVFRGLASLPVEF
jgi:cytochrome P450